MTYYSDNDWKLPLNLAIGFHIIIIVGAIYMPDLLKPKPLYKDIYTVDLINMPEPVIENPVEISPPQPKIIKTLPDKPSVNKAVSIAPPTPQQQPQAPPAKAISIKPLKRKLKKKVPPAKKTVEKKRNIELEKLRRKQLADALKAEQLATEKAKVAAEEAVEELKQMLQTVNSMKATPAKTSKSTSPLTKRGATTSALENRYLGMFNNRIQQFWALPEYKVWDASLIAIVVVTVNKDGTIANRYFEKRSGDRIFDQFVQKTIQDAVPLPPIPPALKRNRMEIGLRFTPRGIQR